MNLRKKFALFSVAVLTAGAALALTYSEEPLMKLVNMRTGFVVIEFKDGQPLFGDRFLEAELKEAGIAIPQHQLAEFEGREIVYPEDPLFEKAFREVYVPFSIASSTYQWQP